MDMTTVIFRLKKSGWGWDNIYEATRSGAKTSEWRDATDYWRKRLTPKPDKAWFTQGYPKGSLPRLEADVQARPSQSDLHPTMKPVELMARMIANSTLPGETVADLFGGSGTTIIASEQLGRSCHTQELDPRYCQITIDRWEAYTGQEAHPITKEEDPQ